MSGDDEYLALLRGTLPSEDDKARMRTRLAALGATAVVSQVATDAAAAQAGGATSLGLFGKLLVGLGGIALIGGALSLTDAEPPRPSRARPPLQAAPVATPAPDVVPTVQAMPLQSEKPPVRATRPRRPRASPVLAVDTLAAENALLAGAVRALHAGDREGARKLLDEHEARFPSGVLVRERERARRKLLGEATE